MPRWRFWGGRRGQEEIPESQLTAPLDVGESQRISPETVSRTFDGPLAATVHFNKQILEMLPPQLVEKIGETASWKNLRFDRLSGGRAVIIDLENPIEIGGRTFKAIKLKGVVNRTRKDSRHFDGDKVEQPKMVEYRPTPSFRSKVDKEGVIFLYEPELQPEGAMLYKDAENEYDMTLRAYNAGRSVNLPIGYGKYKDLNFNGEDVGFVVLGVEDKEDVRIRSRQMSREEGITVYEKIGRELREFHDSGFISRFPHPDNFSVVGDRVVQHDLDSTILTRDLNPAQILGYRVLDLRNYLGYEDLPRYAREAFLKGYFHDIWEREKMGTEDVYHKLKDLRAIDPLKPIMRCDYGVIPYMRKVLGYRR